MALLIVKGFIGDHGSLSNKLFKFLMGQGVELFTKLHNNLEPRFLMIDRILFEEGNFRLKRSTINSRTSIRLSNPGNAARSMPFCIFACRLNGLHSRRKAAFNVLLDDERLRNPSIKSTFSKNCHWHSLSKTHVRKIIDSCLDFSIYL